jgi:hypothetical protein
MSARKESCVRGIVRHNQHERLHQRLLVLPRVDLELDLGVFVNADAVFELEAFEGLVIVVLHVEVLAGGNGGLFDKAVVHGAGKRIAVDDVLEGDWAGSLLDLRGRGQLQPEDGVKFVDGSPRRMRGSGAIRP